MMRVFMTMLCSLLTVCSVSAQISRQEGTDGQAAIYRLRLWNVLFYAAATLKAGTQKNTTHTSVGVTNFAKREVFGTNHDKTGCG